jgi:hypothetical protein
MKTKTEKTYSLHMPLGKYANNLFSRIYIKIEVQENGVIFVSGSYLDGDFEYLDNFTIEDLRNLKDNIELLISVAEDQKQYDLNEVK